MATLVKVRVRNLLAELGQKTKVRSDQSLHLERISIECRNQNQSIKSLWPIKKDGDNPVNQSKLEVITRSRHKARENVHARTTIGFGFLLLSTLS